MADSLFDGRYRYDYIYPRGRSGETLRAVDSLENDRPVVIKRPAPNDAPPIRAGQEVSILNERKALTRLAGQPALTALLNSGQFSVGGQPHQYIVMERAEGMVLEEMVLELAARGERLPELEMLVIVDELLALLSAAHAADIVYNDVDAKHLFWDRERYRLKIIDWGNAVFLEGDEVTAQGISRQSDVYQAGELLYFILTGGSRVEAATHTGDDFRLDFGAGSIKIHTRLQSIVTRAVHPNIRMRYRTIDELRKELSDYRAPVERERSSILNRVIERMRRDRSKDELHSLLKALEPALAMDPGYPAALETRREILDRLSDLEVAADLDAARIYLESGNWTRAVSLLDELRDRARGTTADLIALLLDWAKLLHDEEVHPVPSAVLDSIVLIFEGHAPRAAQLLMTQAETDAARRVQWLLAERISAHMSDIVLLPPNLYRLETALVQLTNEGLAVGEPRSLFNEIQSMIDTTPENGTVSMIALRDRYRSVVDALTALNTLLDAVNSTYKLPDRKLPMSALERALNAAMMLADHMHVIGKQATASPRDAMGALDSSRTIDPTNPTWDMVGRLLNGLYELLGVYQVYVPNADGSDLEGWLDSAQRDLQPFTERLFDEMLVGMIRGLNNAAKAWVEYQGTIIQGNRVGAIGALAQATEAVGTISPTLAGWLNQLRNIITSTSYIERHALYGGLGRALADGWEAYDRGKLADAERLGGQAYEIARSDPERFAARRLRDLAEITRGWTERNGITDSKRTQAALTRVELLYTADESTRRTSFDAQMPSKETYLKAMGKGLVETFERHSTAAVRILFFNYLLLGTLDAHEGNLDDSGFWREAAVRTLGEYGPKHTATRALDDFVQRRRDLNAAAALLNQVNGPHALSSLESTRRTLEENAEARTLSPAIHAMREIEAAVRDWSDGEFRASGIKLENAVKSLDEVESAAGVTLTGMRAWLMDLIANAAELHTASRSMMQVIDRKPEEPNETVRTAHQRMFDVTSRMLGAHYAETLRQWRDTYESFLSVYTDRSNRRSARLTRFNELFRAMFIDRHPAYPLYRHWYNLTEASPEFPAPPTDEPTPRITEEEESVPAELRGSKYLDPPEAAEPSRERGRSRVPMLAIGALVVLLIFAALFALNNAGGDTPQIALTITDTPSNPTNAVNVSGATTEEAAESPTPTSGSGFVLFTPVPNNEPFITPTLLPTSLPTISRALPTDTPPPTDTPVATDPPTETPLPSDTPVTPTVTPTPTITATPTATVPPEGLTGTQRVFNQLNNWGAPPWNAEAFSRVDEVNWRLGTGDENGIGEGELIAVPLPADLLETFYGNNAAARVRSVEATLTLVTWQPALMPENEVYFGMMLQQASNPANSIGLNVLVTQPGVINLGQRQGDTVQATGQRSVSALVARIRLERDPVTGVVTVLYNNERIGQPVLFIAPEEAVIPVLFVRDGGVIVNVTDWTVNLR